MNTTTLNTGALLNHIALGSILLAHGSLKIFVFTIAGTFFEGLGLPAIVAYLISFGEAVGGTLLLLGIYARLLVALLSLLILISAAWTHLGNSWLFSHQDGGWEFAVLLIVLALVVAIQGAGRFALRKLPLIDNVISTSLKA